MSDPQDDDFPLVNGSAGGVVARHRRRERLGRLVRDVWIAWAQEQPSPKPSWLVPWEELIEPDREVDRRIGERLAREGRDERIPELTILRTERDALRERAEMAEAACAEMRGTIPALLRYVEGRAEHEGPYDEGRCVRGAGCAVCDVERAMYSDAGSALLAERDALRERAEKAEAACAEIIALRERVAELEAAIRTAERCSCGGCDWCRMFGAAKGGG